MKHSDLIKVFCKTFGLYFSIQAFVNIKQIVFYGISTQLYVANYLFIIGEQIFNLIFNGVLAWILITRTDQVTTRIIKSSDDKLDLNLKISNYIELILITLSTLAIMDSIPMIIDKVFNYIMVDIVYPTIKLVIGLLTIVNYRIIAKRIIVIGGEEKIS